MLIFCFKKKKNGYGSAIVEGLSSSTTEYSCIISTDGSMDPNILQDVRKMY